MPEIDLDTTVKEVWEDTKQKVLAGSGPKGVNLFINYNEDTSINSISNSFIKKSDEKIIHVRPRAQKSIYVFTNGITHGEGIIERDGDMLMDGAIMTKQCFFLNNSYILDIIKTM